MVALAWKVIFPRYKAHMLGQILGGTHRHPWHLVLETPRLGVQAPEQFGNNGQATVDEHQSQVRDTFEHTFGDETDEVKKPAEGQERVVVKEMIGEPAHGGRQLDPAAAIAVDRNRKSVVGSSLPDLEVALLSVRRMRVHWRSYLHELRMAGPAFDLLDRLGRVAQQNVNRGHKAVAVCARQPGRRQPFVGGRDDRGVITPVRPEQSVGREQDRHLGGPLIEEDVANHIRVGDLFASQAADYAWVNVVDRRRIPVPKRMPESHTFWSDCPSARRSVLPWKASEDVLIGPWHDANARIYVWARCHYLFFRCSAILVFELLVELVSTARARKLIKLARVVHVDPPPQSVAETGRNGSRRNVQIPIPVVRGKHEEVPSVAPLVHINEISDVLGIVDRLARETDMIAQIGRGQDGHLRHF